LSKYFILDELHVYRQQLLLRLEQIPAGYESALRTAVEADIHPQMLTLNWSLHQHLAHVRDAEKILFLPAIQRILDEEKPRLAEFDHKEWMATHYQAEELFENILQEIAILHRRFTQTLDDMAANGWGRPGRHPRLGLRTLQWWVERCLAHAEEHLTQIKELI